MNTETNPNVSSTRSPPVLEGLFIDDDEMMHELIRYYVTGADHVETTHALSLEHALEYLDDDGSPDLIMLDNRLQPHENYLATATAIRDTGFTGSLVVMSGDISHPVFSKYADVGVQKVVDKSSFSFDNFAQKIKDLSMLTVA
ncbi:MAG: response regulator [Yoonia sp.]|uniref:response regulator n=1 Tax=Yoonia sp. TaxID=2212373 RepID=UPI003EF66347